MKGREENVKCPYCGHPKQFMTYENIDLDIEPEAKQKILNEDIFRYECEECGKTSLLAFPCVVSDLKKGYVVSLLAQYSDEQKKAMDEDLKKALPGEEAHKFARAYQRRIVGSINELKEKIVIFDNGFDDRVIEILKLLCVSEVAEEIARQTLSEVRFNLNEEGGMFLILIFIDRDPGVIEINMDMYDKVRRIFAGEIKDATPEEGLAEIDPFWAKELIDGSGKSEMKKS